MFRLPVSLLLQHRQSHVPPPRRIAPVVPIRPWIQRKTAAQPAAPPTSDAPQPTVPEPPPAVEKEVPRTEAIILPFPELEAPPRDMRDVLKVREYSVTEHFLHGFVRFVLRFPHGLAKYLRQRLAELLTAEPGLRFVTQEIAQARVRNRLIQEVHDDYLRDPRAHWREDPTHRGNWARFFRGSNRREFVAIVSALRPQIIGVFTAAEFHRIDQDRRAGKMKPKYVRLAHHMR